MKAFFDKVRKGSRACSVGTYRRHHKSDEFKLSCKMGPDLILDLGLDEEQRDRVARFTIRTAPSGACPTTVSK